ncbi:hypothetical protein GGC47_000365 [Bosea sp. OAE752]
MAMLGAVAVAVVVMLMIVMVVAAAAGIAMGVMVLMAVGMLVIMRVFFAMRMFLAMRVLMAMLVVVAMAMMMVIVTVVIMPAAAGVIMGVIVAVSMVVVVGAALGLEGAFHRRHRTALPAHHLGQDVVVLDVDRVGGDLGRGMAVADMPGDAHQPQRVLGADLQQALRCGLDLDKAPVLQLHGVAISQHRGLVEIEQDIEPAIGLEGKAAAIAVVMVEGERVDDALGPDGGLANDGGGAKHV